MLVAKGSVHGCVSQAIHDCGVCSPREALTTVETLLRARRIFVPEIGGPVRHLSIPFSFYGPLSESKMPHAFRALRSCLAPQRVDAMRPVAEQLINLIPRYTIS